jgi:hypothetical protein
MNIIVYLEQCQSLYSVHTCVHVHPLKVANLLKLENRRGEAEEEKREEKRISRTKSGSTSVRKT